MTLDDIILSIFPDVTTHLKHAKGEELSHIFPYDGLIAVLAVTYSRYTVRPNGESRVSRLFWSAVVGYLAFYRFPYWVQISGHLLSFAPFVYEWCLNLLVKDNGVKEVERLNKQLQVLTVVGTGYIVLVQILFSFSNPQDSLSLFQPRLIHSVQFGPAILKILQLLGYFMPIAEFKSAYDILIQFMEPEELHSKMAHLLFVTVHIQIAMGYLGISFLRSEQTRKNSLVKIEDKVNKINAENKKRKEKKLNPETIDASAEFRRGAGPFIFFVALPYMFQIVFYGATNMYAFHCFRDDLHRTVRLNDLFSKNGSHFVATAASSGTNLSPGTYATNVDKVVTTCYDMVNQNLFSVPKLLLLPSIIAKQPKLAITLTPLIIFSDYIKSVIVSAITTEQERMDSEVRDITSRRTKVEQFDLKNAELIQRSGHRSVAFTERHWISYTEKIQDLNAKISIMKRSKQYFQWLQRHFIMMALVDCALARLIAVGKILAADIFVYARAIEDMINFILMRSKSESELAAMATSVKLLQNLKTVWDQSERRNLLECRISSDSHGTMKLKGLSYTRGAASVYIEDVSITPGIYAVTGANGSGKSTLFRLLMGCNTNRESVDIHSSIKINEMGAVIMPSSDVVEITQNFYFPLFTAPVDWIYNVDIFENKNNAEREAMAIRLEMELKSLKFYPETQDSDSNSSLISDITSVRDDWFSDLSGGQKSKVELVRKVFLADECPKVLLIDETFAPLDPDSKSFVMQKLKSFCSQSIVLVIYHADVKSSDGGDTIDGGADECVESSNFFDSNIHVEDGKLSLRNVC